MRSRVSSSSASSRAASYSWTAASLRPALEGCLGRGEQVRNGAGAVPPARQWWASTSKVSLAPSTIFSTYRATAACSSRPESHAAPWVGDVVDEHVLEAELGVAGNWLVDSRRMKSRASSTASASSASSSPPTSRSTSRQKVFPITAADRSAARACWGMASIRDRSPLSPSPAGRSLRRAPPRTRQAPRGRAGFPRQPGRDGEGSTVSPAASRRYPAKPAAASTTERIESDRRLGEPAAHPARESRSSARAGATNSTGASRVKVARYSSRSSSLACAQWMSSNTSKVGRASAVASANRRAARRPG